VFQFRFDSCREIGLCCVTLFDREAIFSRLTQLGAGEWVSQLRQCCAQAFHPDHHGTLDRWIQAWHRLPQAHQADFDAGGATVTLRGNLSGPQQDLPHASTIPESFIHGAKGHLSFSESPLILNGVLTGNGTALHPT
jgi:hypothetical protein